MILAFSLTYANLLKKTGRTRILCMLEKNKRCHYMLLVLRNDSC